MLIEVKVPQLSESVAEATLVSWHKNVGDVVTRDENLIDIETDKVVLELPAPHDGVLVEVLKGNGDTVIAGELIARIDTEAQAAEAAPAPAQKTKSAVQAAPAAAATASKAEAKPAGAGPAARKALAEKGIDAAQVSGSGPGGRVTKADVIAAATPAAAGAVPPAPTLSAALPQPAVVSADYSSAERPEQRVPMSRLRARVAERLLQSQATNAILTTFNEANMGPVIELRKKYAEKFEKEHGVRLGFMSFFVKAAVAALKKYPMLNASVDGNDIVYHGYFDIGIAVSSPRGLVVPILRDVDQLSLAQIEKKIAEYGAKAKEGKLSLEELTGGTFSISNGGVFGSMLSTPIINPPQSAILGIHATKERPVVENGQIVIRPINYLALSYDHRIIDGRDAVLGLVTMKEALEDPARLLLDI
ncbi:MAG: 2-oxoglutarate dehydrogenase complex dihydrolipoyllysine-residue succinyltransferase [Gammaproteobacteria bacterium]|nr:2-oxoglutarate dehydrogenase complex dihydrolipoyllysine-residue succinyltransferase [Rhodocyclaceae bacterium]MBU3907656.1 2-oxoglutarate dehydrogenase complex dihydrolipoyllysine-residue succinyltransferase [Gammaproteobacteria bacterium]MBU3989201.1 2-oxoglutarate dehydrogenase complex dihydrolipoyllysine-residue succinyltransferase [Gammaproteobacteria bacterium]MBU4004302.1 2-oxoglutarate dehydrogenase complex dihydrolipoyllysine-residue succinyltransferase [Gammaproteobacteria bacterium